jgi:hypothetical protein
MALEKLLLFAEMGGVDGAAEEMEGVYIRQLRSWGPTAALMEHARMLAAAGGGGEERTVALRDLDRRYTQSR